MNQLYESKHIPLSKRRKDHRSGERLTDAEFDLKRLGAFRRI